MWHTITLHARHIHIYIYTYSILVTIDIITAIIEVRLGRSLLVVDSVVVKLYMPNIHVSMHVNTYVICKNSYFNTYR